MKEKLIDQIVELEWEMFSNASNIGGKASCQNRPKDFEIARRAQALTWSEAVLESYLEDLIAAKKEGRNLMTEKYARMMESTSPSEYAEIADMIPPVPPETLDLIDKIIEIHREWDAEVSRKFPHIRAKGRPFSSSQDSFQVTSSETYMRGELATYSPKTLQLYYEHLLQQKAENINADEMTLAYTMKEYGYSSLEELEEILKKQAQK
jgi:hypothetical protein